MISVNEIIIKFAPLIILKLMMNKMNENGQYAVKDISLADFGRREIEIAEKEMPGLIAIRKIILPKSL